jgi:hypothetical protein
MYRLAALLCWMTALRRELSLSNAQHDRSIGPMRDALYIVESALAEGGHIERDRAARLGELWGVAGVSMEEAGQDIDRVVDRYRHDCRVASVADLDERDRSRLVVKVADELQKRSDDKSVGLEVVAATTDEAIAILSTREAWIYRDLQDAIGDWMLRQSGTGVRRFEVMSYREFAETEREPTDRDSVWLTVLTSVIEDLELASDPRHDARIAQLRQVFEALANLIAQFHEAEPKLSSVSETTLSAVQATLARVRPAQ